MDYRVVLSTSARADLRDIVRYVSIDDSDEALRFGRFLISRSRLLSQSPELGRIVPEFEDELIREIIVRAYRVVYRLDDSRQLVEVIRNIDPKALRNTWRAPDGKDVDLEFVVRDYLVHMRHHLDQIL